MIDHHKTDSEERNDLLYLGSLLVGTFFLFIAVYYKLDNYLIFIVTVLTWISPALYKSKNRSLITSVSFLLAFAFLLSIIFSFTRYFDGFFLFSFFMLLGFVVLSNTSETTADLLESNIVICLECNEKMPLGTIYCSNCGRKIDSGL